MYTMFWFVSIPQYCNDNSVKILVWPLTVCATFYQHHYTSGELLSTELDL